MHGSAKIVIIAHIKKKWPIENHAHSVSAVFHMQNQLTEGQTKPYKKISGLRSVPYGSNSYLSTGLYVFF